MLVCVCCRAHSYRSSNVQYATNNTYYERTAVNRANNVAARIVVARKLMASAYSRKQRFLEDHFRWPLVGLRSPAIADALR